MAQTNYTPIILYNSGTTTNAPSASNLASGELAINYTDGKLFYKDGSAAVQVIAWKTTPTTAGGTGLTSYSAGDLPYYASGSALSKLGIGTSGYVLQSNGSAPTWVAQSTLSVGTATNAVNVGTTDNTSSSSTYYPTLVSATSGNNPITTSSTKLSFVPSTGTLTATSYGGAWAGSTIGTTYGGTGLTSFTANGVMYASSTSALATSANFTYDGNNVVNNSSGTGTNAYGFQVSSSLTGATNNYAFYGNIASASNRWNLYMAGTAANYMAGQLLVGTTTLTNGFVEISPTQSTNIGQLKVGGTNNYAGQPNGLIVSHSAVGTAATTAANGIVNTSTFNISAGATLSTITGYYNGPSLNNTTTPTTYNGIQNVTSLGSGATGGTITTSNGYLAFNLNINASATTAITNHYQFNANNVTGTAGVTITNIYGFYGNQASGSGRYNFYAAGSAANYFAGDMQFNKTVTATGTDGAQTINKNAGTVNFAAAATSLVVTNSLVTTSSIIICTVGTNDTTMKSVSAVAASGSFTIYANAAATAETRVNFIVIN